jgi:hypothetical protein
LPTTSTGDASGRTNAAATSPTPSVTAADRAPMSAPRASRAEREGGITPMFARGCSVVHLGAGTFLSRLTAG